jgi:C4-dicarboxylate-specific signal transduction histidine kinase
VTLQCRTDPRTGSLWVERVLLQQVLVNLLQNALEATKGQPVRRVLMRARPSRGGTRLSVVDNGAGFSADVLPRAFDPFITTRTAGMGMGLAITRRLVEAHGGHVSIGKLPTGGAVVSCWFPAVTDITSIVSRGASHV